MKPLTDEERSQLKAQHKKERDKRICDRIKAVLHCNKGWTPAALTEALLLSDDAIRYHIDSFKDSKKLNPISGGSEENCLMRVQQNWSYTLKPTHISISKIFWLHKHGFYYNKPFVAPGKANQQSQKIG